MQIDSGEDAQEEFGWKLVHGDVFRPPRKGMLLSVFLGSGTQILCMTAITLVLIFNTYEEPKRLCFLMKKTSNFRSSLAWAFYPPPIVVHLWHVQWCCLCAWGLQLDMYPPECTRASVVKNGNQTFYWRQCFVQGIYFHCGDPISP